MAPPPPRLAQQSSSSTTAGSSTTTLEQSTILPIRQANPTLVLRAEPLEQRRIQWAEDVVDNEGMGKKSSKVCCIYHKPHAVDESSGDESDSSDSSDSDSSDDGRARLVGGNKRGRKGKRPHNHDHGNDHDHNHVHDHDKGKGKARKPSPNAYEKQPKYSTKKAEGGS